MAGVAMSEVPEWCSVQHPDYTLIETRLLACEWVRQVDRNRTAAFAMREEKLLSQLRAGDSRAVFDAIRLLGLMALWSSPAVGDKTVEIQKLVREIITGWYDKARIGPAQERRTAVRALRRLGDVLAGQQRGRRQRKGAHPLEIWNYYHTILFRLRRALKLLPVWLWGLGNRREKASQVAKACGLRDDCLLRATGLSSSEDRPGQRPLTLEELARIETADAFGVTQHTVANVLTKATHEALTFNYPMPRIRTVAGDRGEPVPNPLLK
jgi:hypothetical protein